MHCNTTLFAMPKSGVTVHSFENPFYRWNCWLASLDSVSSKLHSSLSYCHKAEAILVDGTVGFRNQSGMALHHGQG